jgi:N-acetylmuramoyl-L-alanine amidase
MSEGSRRRFLRTVPGALLALDLPRAHGAGILGVRIWPAPDYTRVTLELDESLKSSHFVATDPPRVVVDLEGVEIDAALREIVAKVQADDPYIASVRVAQNRARVVRLVFDLKVPVAPQVFSLAPNGVYRHRLVLDLYPKTPIDPLAALIDQTRNSPAANAVPAPAAGASTSIGASACASGSACRTTGASACRTCCASSTTRRSTARKIHSSIRARDSHFAFKNSQTHCFTHDHVAGRQRARFQRCRG